MSGEVISKKRQARIERRKAKVAAIFGIGEQVIEEPTEKVIIFLKNKIIIILLTILFHRKIK